mmetsp:Transcript_26303/g.43215  ORF Transcript_26303/g.43215 Transcript_26303/m.43215 type:complete len:163 (+) Transcript_26303:911-1399(+)
MARSFDFSNKDGFGDTLDDEYGLNLACREDMAAARICLRLCLPPLSLLLLPSLMLPMLENEPAGDGERGTRGSIKHSTSALDRGGIELVVVEEEEEEDVVDAVIIVVQVQLLGCLYCMFRVKLNLWMKGSHDGKKFASSNFRPSVCLVPGKRANWEHGKNHH